MSDKSFHNFHSLIHSLSRHAEHLLFSCLRSKETVYHVYSRKLQCFFWTSSAAAKPYSVSLEFIELVPSKKLKMYFYSLHYLIAALKSKLGMNLFQSRWLTWLLRDYHLTLGHPEKQYSVMTGEVTRPCKSPTHYNRGHCTGKL